MSTINLICVCVLLVAIVSIIGVKIYKLRKSNKEITLDQFVNMYGDQIVNVLKDVIQILQININNYPDRESYEKSIINCTIIKIKENSIEFGMDPTIINLFDTKSLTEVVYKVFNGNLVEIFSVINGNAINSNPEMYEDEVVAALTEAE